MKKNKNDDFWDYIGECKEELNIPDYYYQNGIHSYEVVNAFQGDNYNLGTALTYIMRAGKKIYVNDNPLDSKKEDIEKAINHLKFELERISEIKNKD